ncbi:MAG: hypothetical protein R3330_00735 [Saprospiraceae bacterium]|nr:hypothetical protein [Saprospiraceae bacterium]
MFRFLTVLSFLLGALSPGNTQVFLEWGTLADVTFSPEYSEEYGIDLMKAEFGETISQYDSAYVKVTGYMIPIDALGTAYVLSRNPNATCFFCGGAGPETIVGLRMKPEFVRRYKTDEYLTFAGYLQLNEHNDRSFTYMLREAERL